MTRIGKANLARCPKCNKVIFTEFERIVRPIDKKNKEPAVSRVDN
jgi:hypothetical protein